MARDPRPDLGPRWIDVAAQSATNVFIAATAVAAIYLVGLVLGVLPRSSAVVLALSVALLTASIVLSLVALVRFDRAKQRAQ